jgi:hypothetical protein
MELNISTIGLIVDGGVYLQTGVVCEDAIDIWEAGRQLELSPSRCSV